MMYEKIIKRLFDLILSAIAIVLLLPVILLLSVVGMIVMRGNPFFIQPRPGKKGKDGKEKIFSLIKFRTMSNLRGEDGELLSDEKRLCKYGKWLRSTSLDELPSLVNIIMGNLSIVGPRPQLVRDMVFMTEEQRRRHNVRPGLTGLAQINGRNNITWEQKIKWDLKYIEHGISFADDMRIVFLTIKKVVSRDDVVREGTASDIDLGDWLLLEGKVDSALYLKKQEEAKELLRKKIKER